VSVCDMYADDSAVCIGNVFDVHALESITAQL
jgi:hypothetical protein